MVNTFVEGILDGVVLLNSHSLSKNRVIERKEPQPTLEKLSQGAGFWTELTVEAGITSYVVKEALANNSYWPLVVYAGLKVCTNGFAWAFDNSSNDERNYDSSVHRVLDEE
jgi:hypothetical protein